LRASMARTHPLPAARTLASLFPTICYLIDIWQQSDIRY